MKILLSHPTGNANVRAAVIGLIKAKLLIEFHTALASFPGGLLDRLGSIKVFKELKRRSFDPKLKPYTKTWPWFEMVRLFAMKGGFSSLVKHEFGSFSVDAVYQNLDNHVASSLKAAAKKGVGAIYSYEDGAAFSFEQAKKNGIYCLYDLPTGYWRASRRLLKKEKERRPEWASTITGFQDSEIKLARKEEEIRLADLIFVASKFTAETLKEYPGTLPPIEVIPYGFPPVALAKKFTPLKNNRPLKLLFVGKLSQQKGIADLFEAIIGIEKKVQLTIVGRKPNIDCPALNESLLNHIWISSLSHESVQKLMRENDVLVFPSLFDGFGLVISEAMSQGTPVIATERSAGPDLIDHGRNGWLFEAGSTTALRRTIEEILYRPQIITETGLSAMETASQRPWKRYQEELVNAILKVR